MQTKFESSSLVLEYVMELNLVILIEQLYLLSYGYVILLDQMLRILDESDVFLSIICTSFLRTWCIICHLCRGTKIEQTSLLCVLWNVSKYHLLL